MSGSPRRLVNIPSLDGLRAISIAIVFVSHAGFSSVPGGLGVSIFFVISGFLITTLLRVEGDDTGGISLRDFYVRRVFRILPLFYVVLVLGLLATQIGLGDGRVDADATASQFLHWYNFFAITNHGYAIVPGTGIYWSLAIEEHFYLVFPLAVVLMRRWGLSHLRQGVVLLAGCAVVLAWRLYLVHGVGVSQVRTYYGTDTRLDGLLFGCAAALIASPVLDRDVRSERSGRLVATGWPVGLAGVLVLLASLLVRDDGFREGIRYTIQSIAIVACLRYAIVSEGTPIFKVLNNPVVGWFGRMSYGFYLVHQIIISWLQEHVSSKVVVLVVSLALSTLVAWLLHLAVERPVGKLRSRVLRRMAARPATAGPVGAAVAAGGASSWPAPHVSTRFGTEAVAPDR